MLYSTRSRSPMILILFVLSFVLPAVAGFGVPIAAAKAQDNQVTVASYELIGTVNIPTGTQFQGTEIGGLSSITYDSNRKVYYSISDDQGTINPVRYYTLSIDLSDGRLDPGDISFLNVTKILDPSGAPYAPTSLDPEGLVLTHEGQLYFSSEGFANRNPVVNPFIRRLNLNGQQTRSLEIPAKFLPNGAGTWGVRNNLGFESLNVTPDERYLVTASESALAQDGPPATVNNGSFARILQYRLSSGEPGSEYVYPVNPVAEAPAPNAFSVNGLVELLPLDNAGTMLALERSFSVGAPDTGNTIWLYEISTQEATDVSGDNTLPGNFQPVSKRLILNVEKDLGIPPDNIEGMAFGPALPDGRLPLVLVSDNNFATNQTTQFIVLAIDLQEVPTN